MPTDPVATAAVCSSVLCSVAPEDHPRTPSCPPVTAARRLTAAQRAALDVLDNRATDDQWVRTWARSTTRRVLGDRVNYRTAWTLDALGLARLRVNDDLAYEAKITAAGCMALNGGISIHA